MKREAIDCYAEYFMAVNFIIIVRRVREIRLQKQISQEISAELMELLGDCSSSEKRMIYDIADATKKSIQNNKCLQHKSDWL